MEENPNYYQILGVNQNATPNEIRKAYKAQILKCHPDKCKDKKMGKKKFLLVSKAYQILSNTNERKNYDQQLSGKIDSEIVSFIGMTIEKAIPFLAEIFVDTSVKVISTFINDSQQNVNDQPNEKEQEQGQGQGQEEVDSDISWEEIIKIIGHSSKHENLKEKENENDFNWDFNTLQKLCKSQNSQEPTINEKN
ncbi:hypothetical protein M0812_29598 [Anaeramoeba flamelloides]|uniref:J domain-containing protein n=1 Tax=Anaeramoeba flamelloides TaxID=1746091 RepID=A0AAV7Y5Z8_9EUKA|nr:hypothetical protein M0812_29598 [Anaeramoeba flamelloides]